MDQSLSAFLIGAGIGAYGFLCGNKAFQDEIETEKLKRRNLLIASREEKFSLEKRLKAKEEAIISLNAALTAEQAKVQAYAADKKKLKTEMAQTSNDLVGLKLNLKEHDRVLALQTSEIAQLTAALKAEQEKSAGLQSQRTRKTESEVIGEKAGQRGETATIAAAVAVPGAAVVLGAPASPAAGEPSKHQADESPMAKKKKATDGQFPFVVYFDVDGGICTGTVIAPRVILTAGHCIFDDWTSMFADKTNSHIYFGSTEYDDQYDAGSIEEFFIPAQYTPETSSFGDVGLIKLAKPIPSSVKPVQLASAATNMSAGTTLTVVGWGQMDNGKMASHLMYTTGKILPTAECVPPDTMQTTCGGDSGGPYLITNRGKAPVQIGVTSFGPAGDCGSVMEIDVPVNIKYWQTWIDDTMSMYNLRGARAPVRLNMPGYSQCYSGGAVLSTKKTKTFDKCLEMCRSGGGGGGAMMTACKAWTWKKVDLESSGVGMCTLLTARGKVTKSNQCTSGYFK